MPGRTDVVKEAERVLREIFPHAGISVVKWSDGYMADVAQDEDDPICFKFEHMPKLAQAFGTEHLDFQAHNGDHLADSVTWDGCNVLRIHAREM